MGQQRHSDVLRRERCGLTSASVPEYRRATARLLTAMVLLGSSWSTVCHKAAAFL
jgi:hypothetical protein